MFISRSREAICLTTEPRSWPRRRNTNESRRASSAVKSKRSGLGPEPWAAVAAGLASSRKQSQRIGLENGLFVGVAQGQRQELGDGATEVCHTRARPVRSP